MRIFYLDMHEINFLCRTYSQIKSGNKIHTFKHRYITDNALEQGIHVYNFVTGKRPKGRKEKYLNMLRPGHELYVADYVIRENGLGDRIKNITDRNLIQNDDIVIGYFHWIYQRDLIADLPGHKIMFGNHFIRIDEPISFEAKNLVAFVNEVDLSDNEFINKFYSLGETKLLTCPYVFENRFEVRKKFQSRKNKLLGMGTLATVAYTSGYKLYEEWAGTSWIQPMRKEIFDHAEEYPDYIDSCISYIYEDHIPIADTDNCLVKRYKKFRNKHMKWRQKKYTSFDMVDKFNEYRMFVCPEELVGMPGIGFVEGMACGTAYIGIDHSMYRCLGLVPGVHYITYDGTLPGLIETVKYYQTHEEELEKVANCGTSFVREHFNQKKVAEQFIEELRKLAK